jgi:hypothetical protein
LEDSLNHDDGRARPETVRRKEQNIGGREMRSLLASKR